MKKLCSFMMITMSILLLCSCSVNKQGKAAQGTISAELEIFTFDESVRKSDIIARVEIIDKVMEIEEPMPKTIFKANIIQRFKSPKNSEPIINIMQQGNSNWVFNGNKLFEKGEEFILFLKKAEGFENTYWILCEEVNTYRLLDYKGKNVVVKSSIVDEELKDIEDSSKIEIKEKIKQDKHEKEIIKDIQVIDRKLFEEKIKQKVDNIK